MNKYITNIYGHSLQSTAMHGQHMITDLASEIGYKEVDIACYPVGNDSDVEKEKRIEGMLASVYHDSLIIAQMPTWNGIGFDRVLLKKLRERAKKLVVFVHDFVPLMFVGNAYLTETYLESYNLADLVILPSNKMEANLRAKGLTPPVLHQEVWDHVTTLPLPETPKFEPVLKFAGNMERFPFVKNWSSDIRLEVFSNGEFVSKGNVAVQGWKYDDELLRSLHKGGYGLVWSEDIESQHEREYSEMNASYKFGTYLAAGVPIIVNKGIAKEKFIEDYNIGFVCENLDEVTSLLANMTEEMYREKQKASQEIGELVREGFFGKKLLIEIQNALYL